jgi:hypothetical protein
MLSKQSSKKKGPKQQSATLVLRGSLPSLRASSVDILRAKTRDNEAYQFDLQLVPLTFTPTAGVARLRFQFQTAAVQILASLMACFEEIRFLGARLMPRLVQPYSGAANGTGYMKLWIDDAVLSTTSPTYTDAFSRQTVDLMLTPMSVSGTPKHQELQWIATDVEDLDWVPIPGSPATFVPFTVAAFCGPTYVPGTNAGTGTNTGDSYSVVMLDGAVRVQLRTLRTA